MLNGETIETGLPFYGGDVTQFTDADIAALQDAPSADANQSGSAIFDNYLITNSAGSLRVPNVVIATGKTLSASTDAEIGTTGAAVEFAGGTLTADGSFATARPILVDSTGGNIAVLPGTTFTLNSSVLTWSKGTLATANTGVLAFALNQRHRLRPERLGPLNCRRLIRHRRRQHRPFHRFKYPGQSRRHR